MLYQIYETQRSLIEPFSDLAKVTAKLFTNPMLPMGVSPLSQRMAAAFDLMHRLGKDYEKPEFGIRTVDIDGVQIAIHERVEVAKPFCDLLRFKRFSDDTDTLIRMKAQPAVLIVAPLSGHYATLLRDTVRTMLKDHKVYITDWKNARLVPLSEGEFHLDDYVNYVQDFIRHLQGRYGNCHVISVCQPTVPTLAAVSLMSSRGEKAPLSMTMMGGPIDARRSPTEVNNLAVHRPYEWFENNVIYRVPNSFPGAGRRVYPGFLQHTGFIAMNPDRHASSHYDYFNHLIKGDNDSAESHRQFYDEYNAVLDMDADYYLETIKTVFQDFKLPNGNWEVCNPDGKSELVRPQDIRNTGLLTVEGELDDISGSGQTRAAHDLCSGIVSEEQRHYEVKGAGHYGIFSGSRWRTQVYPVVKKFILEHQQADAFKTAPAPAAELVVPEVVASTLMTAQAADPAAEAIAALEPAAAPQVDEQTETVEQPQAEAAVQVEAAAVSEAVVEAQAELASPAVATKPQAAVASTRAPHRRGAASRKR
jgi:poly(3-hydroxybutyrate) depolymerase